MRASPSLNSQRLIKLNFLQKIEILKKTGIKLSINDIGEKINGEWLKVSVAQKDSTAIGYVFDGYLVNEKRLLDVNDFIVTCKKEYEDELKLYIEYTRKEWEHIPNPLVARYQGNDFGDYHHIIFEDSYGKTYDFGFGKNDFGDLRLFDKTEQLNDNPKYLGKQFKIFWEWKISSFYCCSGEYQMVEAYCPSIVKLETIESSVYKE